MLEQLGLPPATRRFYMVSGRYHRLVFTFLRFEGDVTGCVIVLFVFGTSSASRLLRERDDSSGETELFRGWAHDPPEEPEDWRNDVSKRPVILCVDDEWNGLEGRRTLLEQRGYEVLVATSGEEALQLVASHRMDLVLLDYHMPKMNGDVLAQHIKDIQPDVPLALLSAEENLAESALQSVDVFISKSESPVSLLEIVEHLLDLRFLFTPFDDSKSDDSKSMRRQRRIA